MNSYTMTRPAEMILPSLTERRVARFNDTLALARISQLRAVLDIVEGFFTTSRALGEAEQAGEDPKAVVRDMYLLAGEAEAVIKELVPEHEPSSGIVERYGIEILAHKIAHEFHCMACGVQEVDPFDLDAAEGDDAAEAPLSLPEPRVDPATRVRARKVHGLWKEPGTEGQAIAAKQRLEDMAAQNGMTLESFLTACGLTP